MPFERTIFTEEHRAFRATAAAYLRDRVVPRHEAWERAGIVDREVFEEAAALGLIGFNVPVEHGGGGTRDVRYSAVVAEEMAAAVVTGPAFTLHNDVLAPYLLDLTTAEQQARWLPDFAAGRGLWAIAMTEPGTGSDLQGIRTTARRAAEGWVLNGSKTFISNGILSDHVIVVARTDPEAGSRGFSLVVVHRDSEGFHRGRNLDKIGLHAQDTAELHFDDVVVPERDLLGEEGLGFHHLMRNLPQERLSIAVSAVAGAKAAFDTTLVYAKSRTAFGRPIGSFQHSRFRLAEMATELEIAQVFVDRCIVAANEGTLTAVDAAKAKWWTTDLQQRVVDACVQLHGGYGYMREYPVARMFVDARVQPIYGGTNEVMKELIGRDLGV